MYWYVMHDVALTPEQGSTASGMVSEAQFCPAVEMFSRMAQYTIRSRWPVPHVTEQSPQEVNMYWYPGLSVGAAVWHSFAAQATVLAGRAMPTQ
jgi:hypothetical protein